MSRPSCWLYVEACLLTQLLRRPQEPWPGCQYIKEGWERTSSFGSCEHERHAAVHPRLAQWYWQLAWTIQPNALGSCVTSAELSCSADSAHCHFCWGCRPRVSARPTIANDCHGHDCSCGSLPKYPRIKCQKNKQPQPSMHGRHQQSADDAGAVVKE